jgi:glycine/serine hydroxymethyltransferase
VLELAHIALNKNTVPGDKSAMVPHGIRMGAPALTSRGFIEADFEQVAEFVHQGIEITKELKSRQTGAPRLCSATAFWCRSVRSTVSACVVQRRAWSRCQ